MSRAFIKEDAGGEEPERQPPSGPNYVTPRGLELLRAKVLSLGPAAPEDPPEAKRERRYWEGRLASAVLVDNARRPPEDARFGAAVELRDAAGRTRRLRIVGQDEADEGGELASWDSVPARALLGLRAGERASWPDGDGELSFDIVSVRYGMPGS